MEDLTATAKKNVSNVNLKENKLTSLVAEWIRIHPLKQGT